MILTLAKTTTSGKALLAYYVEKYNKYIAIETFATLPFIFQLGIILEYLSIKNIGLLVDLNNINIFILNPTLDANKMLDNYNKTGKFTDELTFITDKNFKSLEEAYTYGINYVFSKTLEPF